MADPGLHPIPETDRPLKTLSGVLVIGSVTIDRNVIAGRCRAKIGGVAAYAGLTYRRHGLPTWVACNVAPADTAVLTPLLSAGIRVQNGGTTCTTRFINRIDSNTRTQEAPSIAAPIEYRLVAAVLGRVDCIHLGPLHPDDIAPDVFSRLARPGRLVTIDIQGMVRRRAGARIVPAVSDHLTAALTAADLVKSDQEELALVLEAYGSEVDAIMKRFGIAEWVATSASKGGCIHVCGGRRFPYEPMSIDHPVDPTGAGDVFFAAYTAARFHLGQTHPAAARHAARLSAEHVAGRFIPPERLDPALPPGGRDSPDPRR